MKRQNKKFVRIEPGEAQPLPCTQCGFAGYKFNDYLSANYEVTMDKDGNIEKQGFTERHDIMNLGLSTFCAKCETRLKFRLKRDYQEPSFFTKNLEQ